MVSQYLEGVNNYEEDIYIYKEWTKIGENYMTMTFILIFFPQY